MERSIILNIISLFYKRLNEETMKKPDAVLQEYIDKAPKFLGYTIEQLKDNRPMPKVCHANLILERGDEVKHG